MGEIKNDENTITTTPAALVPTVDITDATDGALALMRQRVENQKQMLKIALSLTAPSQWTVFAGTDKQGVYRESLYPTGGAADTVLRRAFGLTWGEKTVEIIHAGDGPEAVCSATLMQNGEPVERFEGRRRMGRYTKTETDLRKGAVENMKSVALRDLLGLRFRTPDEMRELGLDVGKLPRRAEFQNHDRQGSELVAPFGRQKGVALPKLTDENLLWLLDAVAGSVADPTKARWKSKNAELLGALEAEKARRTSVREPETDGDGVVLEDSPLAGKVVAEAVEMIGSVGDDSDGATVERLRLVMVADTRAEVILAAREKIAAIGAYHGLAGEEPPLPEEPGSRG